MNSRYSFDIVILCDRVAIVVEGCSVSFGHIDSGTPALLLHMARDAETVGSGDVCVVCSSQKHFSFILTLLQLYSWLF